MVRPLLPSWLANPARHGAGTPVTVAEQMNRFVQGHAVFRTEYRTSTLREHLGLGPARTWSAAVAA
jgi:hypothetical protein